MQRSSPIFYAYCFTHSCHPAVQEVKSLESSPLVLLAHGTVGMIVHEVVNEQAIRSVAGEIARGLSTAQLAQMPVNVLDHETVVDALASKGTVIPIRALTLLHGQEATEVLEKFEKAIAEELQLFSGALEIGWKVSVPVPQPDLPAPTGSPGQDYIFQKMAAYQVIQAWEMQLADKHQQIQDTMGRKLVQFIQKPVKKGTHLQFEFLYLVKKESVPLLRTTIKEQMQNLPEARYMLSGPWAPYHFTKLRLT